MYISSGSLRPDRRAITGYNAFPFDLQDDPYVHLKVPTIHEQEVILDVLHDEMTEFDGIHDISFHVRQLQ